MQKLNFLNTRDRKELFNKLKDQFDFQAELDCLFFEGSDNKIFLVSIPNFNAKLLRVYVCGSPLINERVIYS